MVLIRKTNLFMKWLTGLRDQKAIARIQIRIDRLALGNPGDVRPVGSGISEMRIDYGPGYRIYFSQRGSDIVILLCGGDKTTQTSDIEKAKRVNEGVQ
jgi:putative addiction module killer protein